MTKFHQALLKRVFRAAGSSASGGHSAVWVLLLVTTSVAASDWSSISTWPTPKGKVELFVDARTIRTNGGIAKAWFRIAVPEHTQRGPGDDSNKWVSYLLEKKAFKCAEEVARTDAQITYYSDGSSYRIPRALLRSDWVPVPPSTMGADMMDVACRARH